MSKIRLFRCSSVDQNASDRWFSSDYVEIRRQCSYQWWMLFIALVHWQRIDQYVVDRWSIRSLFSILATDLRKYQMEIFRFFFHIFQKHPNNSDLYTKICFAFLPLISQSNETTKFFFDSLKIRLESTLDSLVQFNLVRYLTIGLGEHEENRHAIKAGWSSKIRRIVSSTFFFGFLGLAVLSELFPLDGNASKRSDHRHFIEFRTMCHAFSLQSSIGRIVDRCDGNSPSNLHTIQSRTRHCPCHQHTSSSDEFLQ